MRLLAERRWHRASEAGVAVTVWQGTGCSADSVDRLLELACNVFGFSSKMKPKLRPNDTIIGLYRIVYPRSHLVDQMEIESFLLQLERAFGLQPEDISQDTTSLAEIATKIDIKGRSTSSA